VTGAEAFGRFRELYERALAEGERLRESYRARGESFWVEATGQQLRWLRKRHDGVADGQLLPGGPYPFGMARILGEYDHRERGAAFERACDELARYWADGLGVPGWDWQAGVPPGWAEAAAAAPREREREAAPS
jgi:hypothetical protein